MIEEPGSFRDPAAKIFYKNNKVYRKLNKTGVERFNFIYEKKIFQKSIENNFLISTKVLEEKEKSTIDLKIGDFILEHEKINYVSYPYEWSFNQLKRAAIFHLDFNLFLLELDATLIDASAYNIQFIGHKPIFIDVLSIKKYREGEPWKAHKQFCEYFLNPLILKSKKGVKFNNWFRGNLEGIDTDELDKVLNFFDKLSFNVFTHVYLLNKFDQKFKSKKTLNPVKIKHIPKKNLILIIKQLKKFIQNLKDYKSITLWDGYSTDNSYTKDDELRKKTIVQNFIKKNNFNLIADLGCNDGEYSELSINSGCKNVIGFDFDINVVDAAYQRAINKNLNFLPLYLDASNPSSNLGWNENERKSFKYRSNFEAILALAFEHHLAIGKNIPLNELIEWLVKLAPTGLIEFVPKNDATVTKMLELKGDIFPNYTINEFEKNLSNISNIVSKNEISESGRTIYEYKR